MSCCGGSCGCGSSCKCGNGCGGCKMYTDVSYSETMSSTETLIAGVAPRKATYMGGEGIEMEAGDNGCKCGSNCSCDPCNCK